MISLDKKPRGLPRTSWLIYNQLTNILDAMRCLMGLSVHPEADGQIATKKITKIRNKTKKCWAQKGQTKF